MNPRTPVLPTEGCAAVAFSGRLGRAYNEQAFRHLLAIEQARTDLCRRSLLLVLISIRNSWGEPIPFPPRVAARVFDVLWLCIRDVDLSGWYIQGSIAGAVLIQDRASLGTDDMVRIQSRISDALAGSIAPRFAGALRVRVLPTKAAQGTEAHRVDANQTRPLSVPQAT